MMGATHATEHELPDGREWLGLERGIKLQLRGWVGDEDDISDLAQDCLTKVWLRAVGFRGQCKFSSWVYRIVRNEFLTWVRKRDARERAAREWSAEHLLQPRRDLADLTTDRLAAAKLLSRLGALDRCILELHYLDDHTSKDIGPTWNWHPRPCRVA